MKFSNLGHGIHPAVRRGAILVAGAVCLHATAWATTWGANPRSATYVVAASNASPHSQSATYGAADATCTASSDDAATIRAAITALPATGGRVLLSEGTFNLASTITVPANVELRGEGIGVTILQRSASYPTTNGYLISVSTGHVTISDLTVDDNRAGNVGYVGRAIALLGADETRLNSVEIKNIGAWGLWIDGSTNVHLDACQIDDATQTSTGTGGFGLITTDAVTAAINQGISISNCTFHANDCNGIYATHVEGISITGCSFTGNAFNKAVGGQIGISNGCTDAVVSGCTFTNDNPTENHSLGVQVDIVSKQAGQGASRVTIVNNVIAGQGYAGIKLSYFSPTNAVPAFCTIKNNIISDCNSAFGTDPNRAGIAVSPAITNFVIEGNVIFDDRSTPLMNYDIDIYDSSGNSGAWDDDFVVTDNDLGTARLAGLNNTSGGLNKQIIHNTTP